MRTFNNPDPNEHDLFDEEEEMCPPEEGFTSNLSPRPSQPPVFNNNFNNPVPPIISNDMMSPVRYPGSNVFSPPRPVVVRPPPTSLSIFY